MRSLYFDVLKGIAIIAVVLYHLGVCQYGYLGVDIFLVFAGYITMSSVYKSLNKNKGFKDFILSRISRLLPLLLIASTFTLLFGSLFMLPDDLENLSQSIIATEFFGNNILQCITTHNYWDVVNEYKPLMHTWYVGLIMQYYLIIPFLYFFIGKKLNNSKKVLLTLNLVVLFFSLVLYLFVGEPAEKFYYLPYRLFEFSIGALFFEIQSIPFKVYPSKYTLQSILITSYILLISFLFINNDFIINEVRLILTITTTAIILLTLPKCNLSKNAFFSNKTLSYIGKSSFSIFVWHQIIFAFTRYSFTTNLLDYKILFVIIGLLLILSYLSYKFIENMKMTRIQWIGLVMLFIVNTTASLLIYKKAGVIRDIPELEVSAEKVHRGMWAEYCDRGFKYDNDFTSKEKLHWFVIGNSFGRDMVNIVLESKMKDLVEISYTSDVDLERDHSERFKKADLVILSTLGLNQEIIENVKKHCSTNSKFLIIGEKNFGECNGRVYMKRLSADYHKTVVEMENGYIEKNKKYKELYPHNYIDMIEYVSNADGQVRVFTDDGRFISQDCRHLTRAGAEFYAKQINWDRFLE